LIEFDGTRDWLLRVRGLRSGSIGSQ
jgi:hypothetical protein